MNKKSDMLTHEPRWLKDLSSSDNDIQRFSPEQMIDCSACQRKNPPTRLACFYCGGKLEINEKNKDFVRPILRKLESWEKGFNIIHLPQSENVLKEELSELASFLRLEKNDLERILQSQTALPLARVESLEEAEIVRQRFEKAGLVVTVIPDAKLEIEKPSRRIRALDFAENSLNLRSSGKHEITELNYEDIKIVIVGSIFQSRREESERRLKGGETKKVGEASEFSADERILDFYTVNDTTGYRIAANSFDFSCLGAQKRLLANENFGILLDEFRSRAVNAIFDGAYQKVRSVLNFVWDIEEYRESTGWQRRGIGKINIGSATTVSNETQFRRYSRMLVQLLEQ